MNTQHVFGLATLLGLTGLAGGAKAVEEPSGSTLSVEVTCSALEGIEGDFLFQFSAVPEVMGDPAPYPDELVLRAHCVYSLVATTETAAQQARWSIPSAEKNAFEPDAQVQAWAGGLTTLGFTVPVPSGELGGLTLFRAPGEPVVKIRYNSQ